MQVSQVAELCGVSVRTVRYYHQIGLLPVPVTRHGTRSYDLSHLARLSRIRWLVDSGLSLRQVKALFDGEADGAAEQGPLLGDLRAALGLLRARAAVLAEQTARLESLLQIATSGGSLSPMPDSAAAFYSALERHAPDDETLRAIWRERDFLEVAYVRGDVPAEAEMLFAVLDDAQLRDSLAAFAADLDAEPTDAALADSARRVLARMRSRFGRSLPEVARSVDVDRLTRLYELFAATGSDRDRRLGRAVLAGLLAVIEQERAADDR